METKDLRSLRPDIQKRFVPFLEKLQGLHARNLRSVWIFGSATGQNPFTKNSLIDSACVFSRLDFEVYRRSFALIGSGRKKRIAAPLFLTSEYIVSSLDVFPIEFLEMQENHVLVYGEDILSSLKIEGRHIRLFCEQQLKGRWLRSQQAYLETGGNDKAVRSLARESLKSLLPIFRNLLRLKNRVPPVKSDEVLAEVAEIFGLDRQVFSEVSASDPASAGFPRGDIHAIFEKYLDQLRRLSERVDQL